MKRVFAALLVILLAAPPFAPAAPQDSATSTESTATTLSVDHSPVTCMVAGTNPEIDAGFTPGDQLQTGRVYFKSALGDAYYYVEMTPNGLQYMGVLPKPRRDAGPITYYVEGLTRSFTQTQTPEQQAIVVEKKEDCGDRPLAALGPSDPVRVYSVTGGTALPPGFSGVSSVVAGAGAVAPAAATAAAGGGSFFSTTTGIITVSAVAVGVAAVIIVTSGGSDNHPASGIR
jgi:hypothetical protein